MSLCAFRRYLPVLRGFPAKYIYDPWNAPESVQAAAKCIIGIHYPKPMVNHAEASRLNIERMKQIYQQLSRYRGLGENNIMMGLKLEVVLCFVWFQDFGPLRSKVAKICFRNQKGLKKIQFQLINQN